MSATAITYSPEAVRIVARACYEAQWEDSFDSLNPAGIEYAMALQVGIAALEAVRFIASGIAALSTLPHKDPTHAD